MRHTIALVGNPNSGKTTLFNALTGSHQYVGNWPGVTVERREALFQIDGTEAALVDLPGAYSLTPGSIEEKVTAGYLLGGGPDVILNIVDATNLGRNLYLTLQLRELRIPMVVALNMTDELAARGGAVDCKRLSVLLGAPVVPISAKKKNGFDPLFEAILRCLRPTAKRAFPADPNLRAGNPRADDDITFLASARYAAIDRILSASGFRPGKPDALSDRIDRVALHRHWAFPVFFLLMAAMLALTFGPIGHALGSAAEALIGGFLGGGARLVLESLHAPAWILSLVLEGVIAGVGGVVTFLPQILLLFLCLSVLEDSGYMARAAFITDKLLQSFGLSGRSFIPMLMGLGCTATAVIGARAVENERDRRMTILLTPFMSCGAKLPVYALFAAAFFPNHPALAVFSLYFLGMMMMAAAGALLRKTAFREGDTPFLMELPAYRLPSVRNVSRRLFERSKDFLTRAGTVLFAMSVVIWFLKRFSPGLRFVSDPAQSMLGALGQLISPILTPLGFGDFRKGVALIAGLVAKEAVVSTLQVLYAAPDVGGLIGMLPDHFTPLSAYSFLVFTLLYPPCAAAIASIRRETGSAKMTWLSVGIQLGAAYTASLLIYQVGRVFSVTWVPYLLAAAILFLAGAVLFRGIRAFIRTGGQSACAHCAFSGACKGKCKNGVEL